MLKLPEFSQPIGKLKTAIIFMLAIFLIIFDRCFKAFSLRYPSDVDFFAGLSFTHQINSGVAFSWMRDWNLIPPIAALILILMLLAIKSARRHRRLETVLLAAVILGAASNLFDRWHYGGVIDYLQIADLITLNLADVLISLATGGLLLQIYSNRET